jgi:hypothetical protein
LAKGLHKIQRVGVKMLKIEVPYTLNHIFIEDHKVRKYELPEEETMMAAEPEINSI